MDGGMDGGRGIPSFQFPAQLELTLPISTQLELTLPITAQLELTLPISAQLKLTVSPIPIRPSLTSGCVPKVLKLSSNMSDMSEGPQVEL